MSQFKTIKLAKCDLTAIPAATKRAIEKAYYQGEYYKLFHFEG